MNLEQRGYTPLDVSSRRTQRNKSVADKIATWTEELFFAVRGDRDLERLPEAQSILTALGNAGKLTVLHMQDSQLDQPTWDALDEALNGTSSSTLRLTICRITFPMLTRHECQARVTRTKAVSGFPMYRKTPPNMYLDISPCNAFFTFTSRGVGQDRSISVRVSGSVFASVV